MPEFIFSPYAVPSLVATVVSAILAVVVWRRREADRAMMPAVVFLVGIAEWTAAASVSDLAVDLPTKVLMASLTYFGITTVVGAWTVFVIQYTGRGHWLTRRNITLLCLEPLVVLLLVFTNEYHQLIWVHYEIVYASGYPILETIHGLGFWAHTVYSYILLVISTIWLVRAYMNSRQLYRGQVATLLVGTFAPWVGNALYLTGLNPIPALDLTPLAFTVTGVMMGYSMIRYSFLDLVPVARDAVIEHMSDGVVVLDNQARVVDANPALAAILNFGDSAQLIGQPLERLLPDQPELVAQYRAMQAGSVELATGEGEAARWFDLRISALRNRQDQVTGRLILVHEITARKQAEAQIRQQNDDLRQANDELAIARREAEEANRLKSEFLATMSHELRTPLNSVIGYSDLLLLGIPGELADKQRDYLERIMSNGERLLALIDDILDLSKIEAGRLELTEEPFDLEALVLGVDKKMQGVVFELDKTLNLHFDLDPNLPPMLIGDRGRLEQILVNLVGNALKFTDEGAVTARVAAGEDTNWLIVVEDTGIGIPPHALDYIFDEFRQVDGSVRREHGGTGLGLSIVQKLTSLMGGTVTVHSEVGQGSTFTVSLPLIVPELLEAVN